MYHEELKPYCNKMLKVSKEFDHIMTHSDNFLFVDLGNIELRTKEIILLVLKQDKRLNN